MPATLYYQIFKCSHFHLSLCHWQGQRGRSEHKSLHSYFLIMCDTHIYMWCSTISWPKYSFIFTNNVSNMSHSHNVTFSACEVILSSQISTQSVFYNVRYCERCCVRFMKIALFLPRGWTNVSAGSEGGQKKDAKKWRQWHQENNICLHKRLSCPALHRISMSFKMYGFQEFHECVN